MLIQNVEVYGLKQSIKRAKYPKSVDIKSLNDELTPGIKSLGNAKRGSGHDNFLKGIIVQFDLTFTIKAWVEAERYHWFDFISSQSTMHKISQFSVEKQVNKYVTQNTINEVKRLQTIYQADQTEDNYLRLLYNIPVGFRLTAGMTTNYQQLKTIYYQRKTHRLPEWRELCAWIETLPMFKELCLGGEANE